MIACTMRELNHPVYEAVGTVGALQMHSGAGTQEETLDASDAEHRQATTLSAMNASDQ